MLGQTFLLAWRQLSHEKMKLAAATAGVVVAVLLMLMQLGFRQAAFDTCTFVPQRITADLVVMSPKTKTMFQSSAFPRRLLYRLQSLAEVTQTQGVYLGNARWRNPANFGENPIFVYGFEPGKLLLEIEGLSDFADGIMQQTDYFIFDELSRPYFGPIPETLRAGERFEGELNRRRITAGGLVRAGATFNWDGNIFMSEANFLRVFAERQSGGIDMGLVKLRPGSDAVAACAAAQALLGPEVRVFTQAGFADHELSFLKSNSPIEFIFSLGAAVGFFIGFVIVYQILYSDVANHLPQYATMKAMGFTDRYLLCVVVCSGLIMALLGYIPGFFMSIAVYQLAAWATYLPMAMTWDRGLFVFAATLTMCGFSSAFAVRKLKAADPADVF